jgi:hypothetical protein
MTRTLCIEPIVGDWYRSHGQLFEVVAVDDDDRLIEIQHADGNIEELDVEDWATRCQAGTLNRAESPEDSSAATDLDVDGEWLPHPPLDEAPQLQANSLEGLDLFE